MGHNLIFVSVFGIQEGRALLAGVTGGAVPVRSSGRY
jgi:hypothetical protein